MSPKLRVTEKGKELWMRGLNTVLENLVTVEVWGPGSDLLLVCLKINNFLGLPLTKAQNFKGGAVFLVGDGEQLRRGRYGFTFGKAEWRCPWEIHVNIQLKG